jgi:hypothetical protein
MFTRLLFLALINGVLWSYSSRPDVTEQAVTTARVTQNDYIARIGVASVTPDLVPLAEKNLPLGFYKDYSCFGRENPATWSNLTYMPVIQYKSKSDSRLARLLVTIAWHTGQIPKLPGTELKQLLVAMNLSKFETWIVDHTGADGIPDGTVFLLGNEPGYRPNNDDRTAKEIVQDAVLIKDLFSRHNLQHQLALGGINTSKNELAREAYGGRLGSELFREILDEAQDRVAFDAFVIHPYPSDVHNLSAQDSFGQIIELRRIMDVCRYVEELIELCLTGRDPELGLPHDDNRLVQRFTWYLLCSPANAITGISDQPGLDLDASALMRPDGTVTDIGEALVRTVDGLIDNTRDKMNR